jgi:hypothetical protein
MRRPARSRVRTIHQRDEVLAVVNAGSQRGARFAGPDTEQSMGRGSPDRLYRAVLPQLGQDVNGRLVAQLPENAELVSYRPVAGKAADRSDADVPVCPFLAGVEAVPLIAADARTASEVRVCPRGDSPLTYMPAVTGELVLVGQW